MNRFILYLYLIINPFVNAQDRQIANGEWFVVGVGCSAFTKKDVNASELIKVDFTKPDICIFHYETPKGKKTRVTYKSISTDKTLTLTNILTEQEVEPMIYNLSWFEKEKCLSLSRKIEIHYDQEVVVSSMKRSGPGTELPRFITHIISLSRKAIK